MADDDRDAPAGTEVVRTEDVLDIAVENRKAGAVRVRKLVDHEHVEEMVPVRAEDADVERTAALEGDSGEVETLPDGSISIPVFEEQLVIETRMVVRERVIVRKRTVVEDQVVSAELRRERVEVDADDEVADRVSGA